jgi:hypothetical protein
MNWAALSTIVELVGVIAVLLTLIYLAAQTRQSADAIRASTRQALLTADQEFLQAIRDDPDLELLRFKPELADHEKIRVGFLFLTFTRMRENHWFQYTNGGLDHATWESYRKSIVVMFATPNGMRWWQSPLTSGLWDPGFVSMVNDTLADVPMLMESRYLRIFD